MPFSMLPTPVNFQKVCKARPVTRLAALDDLGPRRPLGFVLHVTVDRAATRSFASWALPDPVAKEAAEEICLLQDRFPTKCPCSARQLLDEAFLPG
jgi:hypothetical protein